MPLSRIVSLILKSGEDNCGPSVWKTAPDRLFTATVPVEKFIEIGPWPNSSSCLGNGGIIFRGGEPITRRADRSRNLWKYSTRLETKSE